MHVSFVAHQNDSTAVAALGLLCKHGATHDVRIIAGTETQISPAHIACFSAPVLRRNRLLYLASHRMVAAGIEIPLWAREFPFRVAISAGLARRRRKDESHLLCALKYMVSAYEKWNPSCGVPVAHTGWQRPHMHFDAWHERAMRVHKEATE